MNKTGLFKGNERTKTGFTLIELLVVISIIALLLSIMMPGLNRARMKSRQIVCMAHLRDIGMAMHTYAISNKDYFPDAYTLGGFGFRAAPGYKDPADKRGMPEQLGLAGVLGQSDSKGKSPQSAYIDGTSKVWVCSAQPHKWMRDLGNTYAFSLAGMLKTTKTMEMKRFSKTWLVWDNYTLKPYTPGLRSGGSEVGFTIDPKDRLYPHNYSSSETRKDGKAINVMYADSHAAPFYEQQ